MATSEIRTFLQKRTSRVSFQDTLAGFVGKALDNLHSSIGTRSTGIVSIDSGGPAYHCILLKWNDTYYSGILGGYGMDGRIVVFSYSNGVFTTNILGEGKFKVTLRGYDCLRWAA